ncbi:MAG: DUF3822 family protein [Pedobacter sp.]|nr:MAG: DUF3822 family protein [Pedobacter sp.]
MISTLSISQRCNGNVIEKSYFCQHMDNKNSILLIDPNFDPATAKDYTLLVKVGAKSFSYAIINKENKKVIAVFDEQECEDGAIKFAERLKTDSYLTLLYREVKVAVHTENSIAIPAELYNEDLLSANTQFFNGSVNDNLYVNQQAHFGFNTIFAFPKNTDQTINFTEGTKYTENAGLLALAEKLNETALILDFAVNTVNVIYLNDEKIAFQHGYEIDHIYEFNYYLLLMINQLTIKSSTKIYLAGIVHENDEKYNCLLKYFNQPEFLSVGNALDQQIVDDMPAHYYTSLLALNLCE